MRPSRRPVSILRTGDTVSLKCDVNEDICTAAYHNRGRLVDWECQRCQRTSVVPSVKPIPLGSELVGEAGKLDCCCDRPCETTGAALKSGGRQLLFGSQGSPEDGRTRPVTKRITSEIWARNVIQNRNTDTAAKRG